MTKELEKQTPEGYKTLKEDIAYLLQRAKLQAYKAVDNIRVQTYWQIGERITREELKEGRADYGSKVVPLLAEDLGFSRTELFRMTEFYKAYPIVALVAQQLSWSHYRELIPLKNEEEKKFYQIQAIKNNWSKNKLSPSGALAGRRGDVAASTLCNIEIPLLKFSHYYANQKSDQNGKNKI